MLAMSICPSELGQACACICPALQVVSPSPRHFPPTHLPSQESAIPLLHKQRRPSVRSLRSKSRVQVDLQPRPLQPPPLLISSPQPPCPFPAALLLLSTSAHDVLDLHKNCRNVPRQMVSQVRLGFRVRLLKSKRSPLRLRAHTLPPSNAHAQNMMIAAPNIPVILSYTAEATHPGACRGRSGYLHAASFQCNTYPPPSRSG